MSVLKAYSTIDISSVKEAGMGLVTSSPGKRWPGSVVHYSIGQAEATTALTIQNAINTFTANTTFQFAVRDGQENYIEFWEKNEVDPFPGPALAEGSWKSVRSGHELINLSAGRILDWEPGSGHYRIWKYDAAARGKADPLPGPAIAEGNWKTIRSGHRLIPLGGNRILDWQRASGKYRIWNYDPTATGSSDPLPGSAVVVGAWKSIGPGHELIVLDNNRVLDWEPSSGHYRVWNYDPAATGQADPFPGPPLVEGHWRTIRYGHQLINLGDDHILDWEPMSGHYRIWTYDATVTGANDPLPAPPVAQGSWGTIRAGHTLVSLDRGHVLDWIPLYGSYRLWLYDSNARSAIGGNSEVGMAGGKQRINVSPSQTTGVVLHELCHALGFLHEHQRPDRNSYITVNEDNIMSGYGSDFEKESKDDVTCVGDYDYDSIMHYGRTAFSKNRLPTIDAPAPYTTTIGQRNNLSAGDIATLKYIADPLPGPAVAEGTWKSIHSGHGLICLGDNRILDWEPGSGHYRIWNYDPDAVGEVDPFPGPSVAEGTWKSIRSGHKLVPLGGNRVLDWEASGRYRIWNYASEARSDQDPLPGPAVVEGTWRSIQFGHELIPLSEDRILDWEPASGHYRVWRYDRSATGQTDPLPGPPIAEGNWNSIRAGHELINLNGNRVLDWAPLAPVGVYRIWTYDPMATGEADPLPGAPVCDGMWRTIRAGHKVIYLGSDKVLDWELSTGHFRIWSYAR